MIGLLDGVKVIDLTKMVPGGMATRHLADLGADVIKVELPPMGDYFRGLHPLWREVAYAGYIGWNRNKRSIRLDYRVPEGKEILGRMIGAADVFVETSRPGSRKRDGLDYESVRLINSSIVYCAVSGYGQEGPYSGYPSHGFNMAAFAGLASVTHDGKRPHIFAATNLQNGDAALYGALTIVAALFKRQRTGEGAFIDCSGWEVGVVMNTESVEHALNVGRELANEVLTDLGARYDIYSTKDDSVLLLCPIEKKFWVSFCKVIGREDLCERGNWSSTQSMDFAEGDVELYDIVAAVMKTRTKDEWMTLLAAADVPFAPILTPEDLVDDEHQQARGMIISYEHPKLGTVWTTRFPVTVARETFEVQRPAPDMGEQGDEILEEFGYDRAEIDRFRASAVI